MHQITKEAVKRAALKIYLENMGEDIKSLIKKAMDFLLEWEDYSKEEKEVIERHVKLVLQSIQRI